MKKLTAAQEKMLAAVNAAGTTGVSLTIGTPFKTAAVLEKAGLIKIEIRNFHYAVAL